jgi:hypothetical protein
MYVRELAGSSPCCLCGRFYWPENGCTDKYILNLVYKHPCAPHQQIYLIFPAKYGGRGQKSMQWAVRMVAMTQ